MTYQISLKWVAIILGILISLGGASGFFLNESARLRMKGLARNYILGIILMVIAMGWTLWLISFIDLAEYSSFREVMMGGVTILGILTIIFLPDFLMARALGVLLLLGAEVLLSAAFPVETPVRFIITILAYIWAVQGMIFVALPYRLRDLLFWAYDSKKRLQLFSFFKLGLGLLILVGGLFIY